jgi:hypothetical protein
MRKKTIGIMTRASTTVVPFLLHLFLFLFLAKSTIGSAANVTVDACPDVHIIAARETTAPPGFGTAATLVDLVQKTFPGATAEAIDYPAAGGANYTQSVAAGVAAVQQQVDAFTGRCPDSVVVMHGYSQVCFFFLFFSLSLFLLLSSFCLLFLSFL